MIEHLDTVYVLYCRVKGDALPRGSQQSLQVVLLKLTELDVAGVAFLIFHELKDVELKSV